MTRPNIEKEKEYLEKSSFARILTGISGIRDGSISRTVIESVFPRHRYGEQEDISICPTIAVLLARDLAVCTGESYLSIAGTSEVDSAEVGRIQVFSSMPTWDYHGDTGEYTRGNSNLDIMLVHSCSGIIPLVTDYVHGEKSEVVRVGDFAVEQVFIRRRGDERSLNFRPLFEVGHKPVWYSGVLKITSDLEERI